jgi:hypothetical protein
MRFVFNEYSCDSSVLWAVYVSLFLWHVLYPMALVANNGSIEWINDDDDDDTHGSARALRDNAGCRYRTVHNIHSQSTILSWTHVYMFWETSSIDSHYKILHKPVYQYLKFFIWWEISLKIFLNVRLARWALIFKLLEWNCTGLGYSPVYSVCKPMFRRSSSPPSSGMKISRAKTRV